MQPIIRRLTLVLLVFILTACSTAMSPTSQFTGQSSPATTPQTEAATATSTTKIPSTPTTIAAATIDITVPPALLTERAATAALDPIPTDCAPLPASKTVSTDFAPVAGESPVYFTSGNGKIAVVKGSFKHGYGNKVLWVIEPGFDKVVTLSGTNSKDGTPVWFDISSNPGETTSAKLDPARPGANPGAAWRQFPSYLIVPKAGCYEITAEWPGVVIAAGRG